MADTVEDTDRSTTDEPAPSRRLDRISRLEWGVAAAVGLVLVALVLAEPDILEAPFASGRSLAFIVGATLLSAAARVAMLRYRIPPIVRVLVLLVPFLAVSTWLIFPLLSRRGGRGRVRHLDRRRPQRPGVLDDLRSPVDRRRCAHHPR